jgi:hypothetical protein
MTRSTTSTRGRTERKPSELRSKSPRQPRKENGMSTVDSNTPWDIEIKTQGKKETSATEQKTGQQNRTEKLTKKNEPTRALGGRENRQ